MIKSLFEVFQKIHVWLTLVLLAGMVYLLFFNSVSSVSEASTSITASKSNELNGNVAFIQIQLLNDSCLEIQDIINKAKQEKLKIENQFNKLSESYRAKLEVYKSSVNAGIESDANLKKKAEEIQSIEMQAQQVQKQMEELELTIRQQNDAFLKRVKSFLANWCKGKYDYVLTYSEEVPFMLYGHSAKDISINVIKELNKNYKKSNE